MMLVAVVVAVAVAGNVDVDVTIIDSGIRCARCCWQKGHCIH